MLGDIGWHVYVTKKQGCSWLRLYWKTYELQPLFVQTYVQKSRNYVLQNLHDARILESFSEEEQAVLLVHIILACSDIVGDFELERAMWEEAAIFGKRLIKKAENYIRRKGWHRVPTVEVDRHAINCLGLLRSEKRVEARKRLADASSGQALIHELTRLLSEPLREVKSRRKKELDALTHRADYYSEFSSRASFLEYEELATALESGLNVLPADQAKLIDEALLKGRKEQDVGGEIGYGKTKTHRTKMTA